MNYKKLIDKIFKLQEQDNKIDSAFKWFIETISTDYSPFIEFNWIQWFMDCLEITASPELLDTIKYFVYEIPTMKNWRFIKIKDKEYKIKTKEDMVNYLEKELKQE